VYFCPSVHIEGLLVLLSRLLDVLVFRVSCFRWAVKVFPYILPITGISAKEGCSPNPIDRVLINRRTASISNSNNPRRSRIPTLLTRISKQPSIIVGFWGKREEKTFNLFLEPTSELKMQNPKQYWTGTS
jgi:hypothetical protein